jgi:glyoxalase family protein
VPGESPLEPWASRPVPVESAIRGIHGVTTLPAAPYATAATLETLGFDLWARRPSPEAPGREDGNGDQDGTRVRYRASGEAATVVDVLDTDAPYGREGPGTLRHVAVRAGSEAALLEWDDLFRGRDYGVSRVRDRGHYRSIYVREPGGSCSNWRPRDRTSPSTNPRIAGRVARPARLGRGGPGDDRVTAPAA